MPAWASASAVSEGAAPGERSLFGHVCQADARDVELLELMREDFELLVSEFPTVGTRLEALGRMREQKKAAVAAGACLSSLASAQESMAGIHERTLADEIKSLARATASMPRTGSFRDLPSGVRQMDRKSRSLSDLSAGYASADQVSSSDSSESEGQEGGGALSCTEGGTVLACGLACGGTVTGTVTSYTRKRNREQELADSCKGELHASIASPKVARKEGADAN